MKPAYTPDRTGSTVLILLAIAGVVIAVAAFFGLSEKPDVATILIAPQSDFDTAAEAAAALSAAQIRAADTEEGDATSASTAGGESTGEIASEGGVIEGAETASGGIEGADAADPDAVDQQLPSTVIAIPTDVPEATATPEVAAAVQPTPIPAQGEPSGDGVGAAASDADESDGAATLALPVVTGTIEGTFFTRGDENDGAEVAQNLITLRVNEDGTGEFQGVLDITYRDGTHVLLNMSGPFDIVPTNPQVEADLTGAYTLDSPIDADDVSESDAELSISSLTSNGSGSLCTSKCFGFTFPPQ